MEGFARRKSRHNFGDLSRALLGPLRLMDAVKNGEPVRRIELIEKPARAGLRIERGEKVWIRRRATLRRVGRLPTSIGLRSRHLSQTA